MRSPVSFSFLPRRKPSKRSSSLEGDLRALLLFDPMESSRKDSLGREKPILLPGNQIKLKFPHL